MGHFLGKCPASEPLVPMSRDKDGRSYIPQTLWETEALGADAARCLENISQYTSVSRLAWTLLLGRDMKGWALMGRDAGALSKSNLHHRGASLQGEVAPASDRGLVTRMPSPPLR